MNAKKVLVSCLVTVGIVFTIQGLASDIKLAAIKPTGSQALTDEQQGVLAVRTAKASVVNVLGVQQQASSTPSDGITAVPVNSGRISGTGFVIDASGLVVTNEHVVEEAGYKYFVVLADGTQYAASILGQDKFDDVALLKIDAKGLVPAKLGNSDSLETGQSVFAIGNSLGRYQDSVTRGVVSGLARGVTVDPNSPTMHNWIQTDAAISVGNSGGPLINMAGEVVGMNTLIDTEGQGLGFAVPINAIKDSIDQLEKFGKVSRPFLGVQFLNIDVQAQASNNLPVSAGALILKVNDGTPASRAGLKVGDIVASVNNLTVTPQNPLDVLVQKYQAGNQITFHILRSGQKLDLPIILGELK